MTSNSKQILAQKDSVDRLTRLARYFLAVSSSSQEPNSRLYVDSSEKRNEAKRRISEAEKVLKKSRDLSDDENVVPNQLMIDKSILHTIVMLAPMGLSILNIVDRDSVLNPIERKGAEKDIVLIKKVLGMENG
jgi:hypothetical protein